MCSRKCIFETRYANRRLCMHGRRACTQFGRKMSPASRRHLAKRILSAAAAMLMIMVLQLLQGVNKQEPIHLALAKIQIELPRRSNVSVEVHTSMNPGIMYMPTRSYV